MKKINQLLVGALALGVLVSVPFSVRAAQEEAPGAEPAAILAAEDDVQVGDFLFRQVTSDSGIGYSVSGYVGSSVSVTIPTTVTVDGSSYAVSVVAANAFEGQSIEELVIPAGIDTLEKCAFKNCTKLRSVTINANLSDCVIDTTYTGTYGHHDHQYSVFYNCGTEAEGGLSVSFGAGVTYVPKYLFATAYQKGNNTYAHVSSVSFAASVDEIREGAFYNCFDLEKLELNADSGVMTIGPSAFYQYLAGAEDAGEVGLRSVILAPNTNVGKSAFQNNTRLEKVVLGANTAELGEYAFAGCTRLTELKLNEKLQTVGAHAFDGCTSLAALTIPASVNQLGNCAFKNCVKLSSLEIDANLSDCAKDSIYSGTYGHHDYDYSVFITPVPRPRRGWLLPSVPESLPCRPISSPQPIRRGTTPTRMSPLSVSPSPWRRSASVPFIPALI